MTKGLSKALNGGKKYSANRKYAQKAKTPKNGNITLGTSSPSAQTKFAKRTKAQGLQPGNINGGVRTHA